MGISEKYLEFKTDMADERVDTYKRVHNLSNIDGVKVESSSKDGVITTVVDVLNENGAKALSKEVGKYITLEIKNMDMLEDDKKTRISNEVAKQITVLLGENKKSVLVVGLGNVYVTPDALGPKVIQNIEVTRHLINFAKELVEDGTREVSAISPGVLGTTGIETSEIVYSISQKINAEVIIVIDSLASSSIHRIGNTIQMSNTGITPGAGVKNKREVINEANLKVPVIAIGIPTVVDMATITNEAIDKLIESTRDNINEFDGDIIDRENSNKLLQKLEMSSRYDMIANALDTNNYIVTPKEINELIENTANILAEGINNSM